MDFSKNKGESDFGIGFYLTNDDSVARRRAFQKTEVFNRIHKSTEHPSLVSVILETDLLTDMSVRVFEYCNDEWVQFRYNLRTFFVCKIYLSSISSTSFPFICSFLSKTAAGSDPACILCGGYCSMILKHF